LTILVIVCFLFSFINYISVIARFLSLLLSCLSLGVSKSVSLALVTLLGDLTLLGVHGAHVLLVVDLHLAHLVGHGLRVEGGKFSALGVASLSHVAGFNLVKVILLGSEDRTRTCDTNPSDEGSSGETVVLHGVKSDQRSSATETSFAMDGNSSFLSLNFLHESFCDVIWGSGSVNELEIEMLQSLVDELFAIVSSLVQTDD